jgi:hypothetical protein
VKTRVEFAILPMRPGHGDYGQYATSGLIMELANRWPKFVKFMRSQIGSFHVETDESDPAYSEIVEFLRRSGREPYLTRRPPLVVRQDLWRTHYEVKRTRVFEPHDFDGIEYCRMRPRWWLGEGDTKPDGTPEVRRLSITEAEIGTLIGGEAILCVDSLRSAMAEETFDGLHFQETKVVEDDYEDLGVEPPPGPPPVLWQMLTDRQAPPVSNPLDNTEGQSYDPARDRWCDLEDDYYPPILRFRSVDLEETAPFDFAKLREPLPGPKTIVSRRFFDWCEARKLNVEWHPIVLE